MHIIHVSSECAPVAKVGGLADVVSGLGREELSCGHRVEVILPKYDGLRFDHIRDLHSVYDDLWVPWFDGAIHCTVLQGEVLGLPCYFIDAHSPDGFFNRGIFYGADDDVLRFAFFDRAATEFLYKAALNPDVVHCHDWQTGLVPVLLDEIYRPLGMAPMRVGYTIHNFKHQGVIGGDILLSAAGLHRPEHFFTQDRLRDDGNASAVNLMRGGIVYADFITTVSPQHAEEVLHTDQGHGLQGILGVHREKFSGVLNGIDEAVWDPQTDPAIPFHYDVDDIQPKYADKKALRERLWLRDTFTPILAYVGRLDAQKGVHLLHEAIFYAISHGAQFVLLGSAPDPEINREFWALKAELNDNPDVHIELAYDAELSRLIYAGADIMLVPSNYEPCGLAQLIAMRYGTVPVVRRIGGLVDTVFDREYSDRPEGERNGFVFRDPDRTAITWVLERALRLWYDDPVAFRSLMENGMRQDHSWKEPAQRYLAIYEAALQEAPSV